MRIDTISRTTARRLYNALGRRLDHADRYEAEAKARALAVLGAEAGDRVLHLGVGTGHEQAYLATTVTPDGTVVGLDLSRGMLLLTREQATTPLVEGDATRLPFTDATFDSLFSAYMVDLLPTADIPLVLQECRRVVRPGGRIVLLSLTEGTTLYSRLFVAWWKLRFRINPEWLGGCRPLQLEHSVAAAGFSIVRRQVIIERGFPSELIVATAP